MAGEKEWRMEEAKKRRGEEARGGEAEEGRREGPRVHNPLTDSFVEWLTAQCATLEPEQRGAAMTVGIISPLTYSHHYPPSSPPPQHPCFTTLPWTGSSGTGQVSVVFTLSFRAHPGTLLCLRRDCPLLQMTQLGEGGGGCWWGRWGGGGCGKQQGGCTQTHAGHVHKQMHPRMTHA